MAEDAVKRDVLIVGFGMATEDEAVRFDRMQALARVAIRNVAAISPKAAEHLLAEEAARLRRPATRRSGGPKRAAEDDLKWALVLKAYEEKHPGLSAAGLARVMYSEKVKGLALSEAALAKQITRMRAEAEFMGGYSEWCRDAFIRMFGEVVKTMFSQAEAEVLMRALRDGPVCLGDGPFALTARERDLARLVLNAVVRPVSDSNGG